MTEQGRPSKEVANELGICTDTLRSWQKAVGFNAGQTDCQNRDAKRAKALEAENGSVVSSESPEAVITHGANVAPAAVNSATMSSRENLCVCIKSILQWGWTASSICAWCGDITYIPTDEGWLYLVIVKDLCTKKIVGYAFSDRINTQLTLDALDMAVRRENPKKPLIFHSGTG